MHESAHKVNKSYLIIRKVWTIYTLDPNLEESKAIISEKH